MSITEESIEKAVHWLSDNATKAAQARANREYVEQFRKTLKAQIMQENSALPLGAQEREAYADPRYAEHLNALREAVEQDERFRWLLAAAQTRISAWQTINRSQRTGV